MRKWQNYIASLLFYLLFSFSLKAQSNNIKYIHYTRHDVLVSNQVNCIVQDKKKFIWLGTSNGLQCFDGNRWRWLSHQNNNATSVPGNDVNALSEDMRGRFWVQAGAGICLLNRNNNVCTPATIAWSSPNAVRVFQSLVSLPDDRTWFTTAGGGLYYYDETAKAFTPSDKIIPFAGYEVYQIAYDSSSRKYFLGTDKGIVSYNTRTKQYAPLNTPTALQSNVALYLNDRKQLWFSSAATHSCYDLLTGRLIFCDSVSKLWGVLGYTTDRSGTTWGYGATFAKMNLVTGRAELPEQTPEALYGLNFQNGYYMMEDADNNYWMATNNGVFLYNRIQQQFVQHPIKSYHSGEIIQHVNLWGFIEMADSSIVAMTTRAEGLYFFDRHFQQIPSKFNLSAYANAKSWVNIRCGVRDADNHLWVACEKGPLLKLYPENGRVEKITDAAFAAGIYSMTTDGAGNLWLGSFRHAILRRDKATGKFNTIVNPIGDGLDNVYCLLYDSSNYIWAATSKSGLLKINTQTQAVEKTYTHVPGKTIFTVIKSCYNQLMMATPDGVVLMDMAKENFRLLTTADGLPDNNAASFVKGHNKNIWIASENGVSTIQPDGLKARTYGILEGLTNESFNIGAGIQLQDGRILFGHNEGFTSFSPAAYMAETKSSPVQITGIRLFDTWLDTDSILQDKKNLVLNYRQNFLTIEFSDMHLLDKGVTTYYYQLEGVDKNWVAANSIPQAVYTYLPGGNYTFKVKTTGGITAFKIKVIPPVWKTGWFYLLAAAIVCALVYLFLRSRFRQQLAAEKGRSRIAKDLHDDMGSSLSTINILSEMAKTTIDTDIPTTKKFIHQISENSNRIMESLDDIVWNIDTANDTMENTISRMREFAGNLLEAKGITYTFKTDDQISDVHLELGRRHDFFMIFKEAVNNLAKYSACTTANIQIAIRKNHLQLVIEDNGKGFEQQQYSEGNGLENMQQRATTLKGILTIQSEPNRGTTIALNLPV